VIASVSFLYAESLFLTPVISFGKVRNFIFVHIVQISLPNITEKAVIYIQLDKVILLDIYLRLGELSLWVFNEYSSLKIQKGGKKHG